MFIESAQTRRVANLVSVDSNGRVQQWNPLHRIRPQFSYHGAIKVTRKQFPIRLAFSETVIKGQRQILNKAVRHFHSSLFFHTPNRARYSASTKLWKDKMSHSGFKFRFLDSGQALGIWNMHQVIDCFRWNGLYNIIKCFVNKYKTVHCWSTEVLCHWNMNF